MPSRVEQLSSQRIQDDVHAFAAGLAQDNVLKQYVLRVADPVARYIESGCQILYLLFAANGCINLSADHLCDLTGGDTDTVRCTVDQSGLMMRISFIFKDCEIAAYLAGLKVADVYEGIDRY